MVGKSSEVLLVAPQGDGWGLLSLEKVTDCSPTSWELWPLIVN